MNTQTNSLTSPVSHFVCGDPPSNSDPAIVWMAGDESALLSILQGLAALHRLPHVALQGNITEQSFCRDQQGELFLYCGAKTPSQCEQTPLNDRMARLYVNAGATPHSVDDLTAIGVVLAEWLVGLKNLPAVDGDMKRYRSHLAGKLKNVPRAKRLSQPCRKLIDSLLLADEHDFKDAGDCLGRQSTFATWSTDGKLQFASVRKILVTHAWVPLIALVAVLALLMTSWHYRTAAHEADVALERSEGLKKELQGDFDKANTLVGDLQKNETVLTEQLTQTEHDLEQVKKKLVDCEDGKKTPLDPPPDTQNPLSSDPRYLTHKNDPYLAEDLEFQKLVRKELWTVQEEKQVDQKLSTIVAAGRVWWDAVDNSLSLAESNRLFEGESEEVEGILKGWLAAATKSHDYTIAIQCSVPSSYNGYSMRMTLENLETGSSTPVLSDAESQRAFKDEQLKLNWKAGQPIRVWMERFSYWNAIYNDEFIETFDGAFSLYRLGSVEIINNDLKLRLSVEGLPGPPKRLVPPPVSQDKKAEPPKKAPLPRAPGNPSDDAPENEGPPPDVIHPKISDEFGHAAK